MAKLYKLTDENGMTQGGTQWGPGVTHSGTGEGGLCGPGYIHAYEHPLLAALLNPVHAGFQNPRLWEAAGEIALRDGQLKCGCVSLTTVREIPLPVITTEQRVRFAILCAKTVCGDEKWNKWADDWLSGKDRSQSAAESAARAAMAAEAAAAWAAESAESAAWAAAQAAAWAAESAESAETVAARAAESAARSAAWAADCDLASIAEKAVSEP